MDIYDLQITNEVQDTKLTRVEGAISQNTMNILDIENDILNNIKVDIINNTNAINKNIYNIAENLTIINTNTSGCWNINFTK